MESAGKKKTVNMPENYHYLKALFDHLTEQQSGGPPPELYPTDEAEGK